jgi:hypothetical protein
LNDPVAVHGLFLGPAERGNPVTRLDRRHPDGAAFTPAMTSPG